MRKWKPVIACVIILLSLIFTIGCRRPPEPDRWDSANWEYGEFSETTLRPNEWSICWSNVEREPAVTDIVCDNMGGVLVTDACYEPTDRVASDGPDGCYPIKSNGQTSLTKFSTAGQVQWAKMWAGISTGDLWFELKCVDVDSDGNIYIAGYTSQTVDFDPGPETFELTSNGLNDAFLCKLDRNGDFVWAVNWGGDYHDGVTGISVDGTGHIYVTGHVYLPVNFDPGEEIELPESPGLFTYYVSRFDPDGIFLWHQSWELSGNINDRDFMRVLVDSDPTGNVAVLSPNPGDSNRVTHIEMTDDGERRVNALQYHELENLKCFTPDGETKWEYALDQIITGMEYDENGDLYLAGHFIGLTDLDPGTRMNRVLATGAEEGDFEDPFLMKFDPDGRQLWAGTWGGDGYDYALGMVLREGGIIYVFGTFEGTADFDPSQVQRRFGASPVAGYDSPMPNCYLSTFNSEGRHLHTRTWIRFVEDTIMAVDRNGWIYNTFASDGTLTRSGP